MSKPMLKRAMAYMVLNGGTIQDAVTILTARDFVRRSNSAFNKAKKATAKKLREELKPRRRGA